MLKAYVGVVSKYGLSLFQPQRDESMSLVRQSLGNGRRRLGFWAVLSESDAHSVQSLFLGGNSWNALLMLDQSATDIGPILVSYGDDFINGYHFNERSHSE